MAGRSPAAEAASAFFASAVLFLLVGAAGAGRHHLIVVLAVVAAYVYVVVFVARRLGPSFGFPMAIAGAVAIDWFYIPPIHTYGSDSWQNWLTLGIYLSMGVLVGMLAAGFRLRAAVSEQGRDFLLDEQAALRRVATLVARHTAPAEVFAAVARELGQLLAVDATYVVRYESDHTADGVARWARGVDRAPLGAIPLEGDNVITEIARTRRPARMDSYDEASGAPAARGREAGVRAAVGAPIIVEGELWGAMVAASNSEMPLPAETEEHITAFSELVATALANTDAQVEIRRLADEQASLRRVATLVAQAAPRQEMFTAVVEEIERLLPAEVVGMAHYGSDGMLTIVASSSHTPERFIPGTRWPLGGRNVSTLVAETGRPARLDSYAGAGDTLDLAIADEGIRMSIGTPIVVEGKVWGVMTAASMQDVPFSAGTEARLAAFTDLVATAISNTEARAAVRRLGDEQAALRRVATLVARGVPADELFPAVTEEVGRLLETDLAGLVRFDSDGTLSPVAAWSAAGEHPPLPECWPVVEGDAGSLIAAAGGPTRIDDWNAVEGPIAAYLRGIDVESSLASPIVVEGCLWGGLAVHTRNPRALPADAASRLENFTDLVATAISNTEARAAVQRLADEQAALRRVATLVAQGASASEVFESVAEQLGRLLGLADIRMLRYEDDRTAVIVAARGDSARDLLPIGDRMTLDGDSVTSRVIQTQRPARIDDYSIATGCLADRVRASGLRSAVGGPIVVDGKLWGVIVAASAVPRPLPPDTETRMGQFTALVATAISNIQARSDLAASRARIVAATDEERRRVVRDLHDGAQQRLLHTVVTLKLARRALGKKADAAPALVGEALDHAETAMVELRELAHGIMPSVLNRGGLRAGAEALASRMPVPVEIGIGEDRFPSDVEATAYFVVAEALTNVAKHARAGHATVVADVDDGMLRIEVADDGVGTADPNGHGLLGLRDRLASADGALQVLSAPGDGTRVIATVPLVT